MDLTLKTVKHGRLLWRTNFISRYSTWASLATALIRQLCSILDKRNKFPDSKFVILGFIDDDLNRNLTGYRKLQHDFGFVFTKPRFELRRDVLNFIANPIQSKNDISKLTNDEFVRGLVTEDPYFLKYKFLEFPYLLKLLRADLGDYLSGFPYGDGLSDSDRRNLFKAQLKLFKEKVCSRGSTLIFKNLYYWIYAALFESHFLTCDEASYSFQFTSIPKVKLKYRWYLQPWHKTH